MIIYKTKFLSFHYWCMLKLLHDHSSSAELRHSGVLKSVKVIKRSFSQLSFRSITYWPFVAQPRPHGILRVNLIKVLAFMAPLNFIFSSDLFFLCQAQFVRPPGSIFEAYSQKPAEQLSTPLHEAPIKRSNPAQQWQPQSHQLQHSPFAKSYAFQNIQHLIKNQFQHFTPWVFLKLCVTNVSLPRLASRVKGVNTRIYSLKWLFKHSIVVKI